MATKKGSGFKAGRPSSLANGNKVEGVNQHKALAMGGHPDVQAPGKGVVQNSTGKFQRRK